MFKEECASENGLPSVAENVNVINSIVLQSLSYYGAKFYFKILSIDFKTFSVANIYYMM